MERSREDAACRMRERGLPTRGWTGVRLSDDDGCSRVTGGRSHAIGHQLSKRKGVTPAHSRGPAQRIEESVIAKSTVRMSQSDPSARNEKICPFPQPEPLPSPQTKAYLTATHCRPTGFPSLYSTPTGNRHQDEKGSKSTSFPASFVMRKLLPISGPFINGEPLHISQSQLCPAA